MQIGGNMNNRFSLRKSELLYCEIPGSKIDHLG